MFKRTTIFALVAFASVTTAIVAPTTASAWGHGGRRFGGSHFGGRHFGGMHFGYRFGHFSRWSHYGSWRWERYRWYPRGPIVFGGPTEEGGGSGPGWGQGAQRRQWWTGSDQNDVQNSRQTARTA